VLILVALVLLFGAVLGMRFKVLILVPAIGFAAVAVLAGGLATNATLPAILLAAVLASIGLQVGYFGGIVTRYSMTLARTADQRKASRQVQPIR
jgi:hypothetical protein